MSRSARRTLTLLTLIAESERPLMLMEIAREADLDKSTASRLLTDLESTEMVERDDVSRAFAIGPQGVTLAAAILRNVEFRFISRSRLASIRDLTQESVMIQVRSGLDRVVVNGVEGTQPMRRVIPFGEHHGLASGVSGAVLLSMLEESELGGILDQLGVSAARRAEIIAGVEAVWRDGYLAGLSDSTAGVAVLCVPLRSTSPDGPPACLTISGPVERWTLERIREVHAAVLELVRGGAGTRDRGDGADASSDGRLR